MTAPQPPPGNLKDRIAALQQRNGTPSPTSSPTFPSRDASVTPPRGSLRDKIAKFEKRGGVPIPRGSFAMGAPPLEDTGSTKSRELYGNRVAALGKGRPTAPGNSGNRAVTSPPINLAAASNRTSPDGNAAIPTTNLTPNLISHSMPPSRHTSSGFADRPASALGIVDKSDEAQQTPTEPADDHQDTLVQKGPVAQPESPPNTQDAMPSEPIDSAVKLTSEPNTTRLSSASSVNSSSTGSTTTTVTRRQSSSAPLKVTLSKVTSTQARSIATSLTPSSSHSTSASPASQSQEGPPAVTPKLSTSTVQAHVTVEQFPVKEASINATSRGSRLDHPLTVTLARSDAPSVEDGLKRRSTPTPTPTPTANKAKTSVLSGNTSTPAPSVGLPANKSSADTSVSGDLEPSAGMAPSTIEPGRPSFSAVVHRGENDVRPDSAQGAPSRSSIATSRPSSSSFKPGTDGGVVRSKRNFKHLGAVPSDPPMSPIGGDLGAGELAALLQEAAWLEQRLSNENVTSNTSSGKGPKVAMESAVSSAAIAKGGQVASSAHVVVASTRTKGRGLTLDSSTSALPTNTLHSPIRSSPSTPSFQVHPAGSNSSGVTPPKSARPRKYFSLRGALRGQRLSMSSEMSSDDSAPVATPPSPNFELSMPQAAHGHGNDTMSIRSMFSIRSNRSGKSDSLSPRRSVSRASSFAERLFNRAMRTKSMLDDPDDAIPEQSPMLPPIISETPGALLSTSPISASSKNETPFDRDIFDAFPNVPSDIPQGPASYLFPVPPKTVEEDFKRSSIIKVSTSENGGSQDTPTWLR